MSNNGSFGLFYDETNASSFIQLPSGDWMSTPRDAQGRIVLRQYSIAAGSDLMFTEGFGGVRPELLVETVHTSPHGANSWTTTGGRKYVLGPNPDERLIFKDTNGTYYYPHVDRQGSLVGLSTGGQNVITYAYGPYGEPKAITLGSSPGASAYPYLYTGQFYNSFLQLYDYKARLYDPGGGRFLQPDPIGTGDDLNLYTYTHNDPLNGNDPGGEQTCDAKLVGDCNDLDNSAYFDKITTGSGGGASTAAKPKQDPLGQVVSTVIYTISGGRETNIGDYVSGVADEVLGCFSEPSCAGPLAVEGVVATTAIDEGSAATTAHGATRIAGQGATRGGALTADEIAQTRTVGAEFTQRGGGTVHVEFVGGGRANIVVDSAKGKYITSIKSMSPKSLSRIAKNYDWKPK